MTTIASCPILPCPYSASMIGCGPLDLNRKRYKGRVGVPLAFNSHCSRMNLPASVWLMRSQENITVGV